MAARSWIQRWDPEDETFWSQEGGEKVARRNLAFSVLSEHIGFSDLDPVVGDGAVHGARVRHRPGREVLPGLDGRRWSARSLRVPYTFAVARFGGRNWTIVSARACS